MGKPKVKKMNLEETLPSPFGRRVEPPTQAIKSDAAKKLTKKKKVRPVDVYTETRRVRTPGYLQLVFCFCFFNSQGDVDPVVKLEFDDDGLGGEGGAGDNSVAKPKAPRVKKEKKEPGQYSAEENTSSNSSFPVQGFSEEYRFCPNRKMPFSHKLTF